MKPSDILMQEHRIIEQILDCLEQMLERAESAGRLEEQCARDAVDFFRNFADKCHNAKEENQLFPMMEAKGFSAQQGPTGQMRHEHEQGRSLIRKMDEAIPAASSGDNGAVRQFAQAARDYGALLRQHIQKEDHCLFPMANEALDEQDQKELEKQFERVENEEMKPGTHEKYHKIAERLATRYGVEKVTDICHGY
jgi:hemerythrin-like domain-containing protein